MAQSCRTCKFLDVALNAAGKIVPRKSETYRCLAPDPMWPALPDAITKSFGFRAKFSRAYMNPEDGTSCPTYETRGSSIEKKELS